MVLVAKGTKGVTDILGSTGELMPILGSKIINLGAKLCVPPISERNRLVGRQVGRQVGGSVGFRA